MKSEENNNYAILIDNNRRLIDEIVKMKTENNLGEIIAEREE
jgi:hypothetical protein